MERISRSAFAILALLLWACPAVSESIAQIEVRGTLRKVSESLIRSTISLQPGIELSQENVQQAIRDLQGLGVFSDIRIYGESVPGGVKVIIQVEELPALAGTRFRGRKEISERDLTAALTLVKGQVVAPWDVSRAEQAILKVYHEKGYLHATVSGALFEAEEPGTVFVQFDIDEGEKVKVERIVIVTRHADGSVTSEPQRPYDARRPGSAAQKLIPGVPVRELLRQMQTKEKRWYRKGEFKREILDEDLERLLAYYRQRGYQQVQIVADSVFYDESSRNLAVYIEIEEGTQYRLGQASFTGNTVFTHEELVARLPMRSGELYRAAGLQLADQVRAAYHEKGYLDTRVTVDESMRGDSVDAAFTIFEGQPWKIRKIGIAGNTKTREKVIRREVELRPGDIYNQALVQESQRRIYMLNHFKGVQIQPEYGEGADERYVDLTFQVEERPTGQASMGAGYSDRDKLVGQIGLQIPNFRGLGQSLDFSCEFGTQREQLLVGFAEPWFMDTPTNLSARVYTLEQEYYDYYDYRRNAATVRIGRRLHRPAYSSLSLGYTLESSRYSNFGAEYSDLASSSRYQPTLTSTFDLTYQRDRRDLAQFPTRGTLFYYKPEVATSIVAGDVDFHRHEIGFNYYRPSWWRFVWSLESKIAFVDGFSKYDDANIPFWDRFTPGGVDWWDGQVRGYPDQSLGPRQSGIPVGGNSMLVVNLEYRAPLASNQVYGLLFLDAGNAWQHAGDLNPFGLRRSVGFGFRIVAPMVGTIGFDFGYGFDRKKVDGGEPGWLTHFQFGPRFF